MPLAQSMAQQLSRWAWWWLSLSQSMYFWRRVAPDGDEAGPDRGAFVVLACCPPQGTTAGGTRTTARGAAYCRGEDVRGSGPGTLEAAERDPRCHRCRRRRRQPWKRSLSATWGAGEWRPLPARCLSRMRQSRPTCICAAWRRLCWSWPCRLGRLSNPRCRAHRVLRGGITGCRAAVDQGVRVCFP